MNKKKRYYYPKEVRDKARDLVLVGLNKTDVGRKIGVDAYTIMRWTRDLKSPYNQYWEAMRGLAKQLLKTEISKHDIARRLGVHYTTVIDWLKGVPTKEQIQLKEKQREAVQMARLGIKKGDIARTLGIKYSTLMYWVRGINSTHPATSITGKSLEVLKKIMEEGVPLPENEKDKLICLFLAASLPIKLKHVEGRWIAWQK
jgi:transposase-like protein